MQIEAEIREADIGSMFGTRYTEILSFRRGLDGLWLSGRGGLGNLNRLHDATGFRGGSSAPVIFFFQ